MLNMKKFLVYFGLPLVAVSLAVSAFILPSASLRSEGLLEDHGLTEKGRKKILKELYNPIKKELAPEFRMEMFSRCPSGLSYTVADWKEGDTHFMGTVNYSSGCRTTPVCEFRLSLDEKTLEVRKSETTSFESPTAFLQNDENLVVAINDDWDEGIIKE